MSTTIRSEATRSVIEVNGVDQVAINDDGTMELLVPNATPTGNDVVSVVNFDASFGSDGYQKLPNGFIIQWGRRNITSGSTSGTNTVTLPIAFPNAMFQGVATDISNSSNKTVYGIETFNTTSFELTWYKVQSTAINGARWIAIGH